MEEWIANICEENHLHRVSIMIVKLELMYKKLDLTRWSDWFDYEPSSFPIWISVKNCFVGGTSQN